MPQNRSISRAFFLFGLPLAIILFTVSALEMRHGRWMWDFHVYQAAAAAYLQGLDAYDHAVILRLSNVDLFFIYPPHIWVALGHMQWLFAGAFGQQLYLVLFTGSIAALIVMEAEALLPAHWWRWPAATVLFFFFYKAGAIAYNTGNIAIPAYAFSLAALFYAVRKGNWLWFCLCIALFAQMKPHILIMLAIPLYYDGRPRQWRSIALAGLLAVVPYVVDRAVLPEMFRHFTDATRLQLAERQDWGVSALGLLPFMAQHFHILQTIMSGTLASPTVLMTGCAALTLASLLAAGWRMRGYRISGHMTLPDTVQLSWCLLAALTANPRLKEYDLCMAAIPFAVVAGYVALHSRRGLAVTGAGYLLSTCCPVETRAFIMFMAVSFAAVVAATEPAVALLKAPQAR